MYAPTWNKRTSYSKKSLPKVTVDNFYLTSAFSRLYDSPSPFPYFEYRNAGSQLSPIKMLKRWFITLRHLHRFRIQYDWNSREKIFPSLVEYFPDADPGVNVKMINPLYRIKNGKKFMGTFLKCAEQLQNMEKVIPKEKFQNVCEIGGGFGAMAEMVIKRHKPHLYCIIDLPETLEVSYMYLSSVFPDKVQRVVHGQPITLKPNDTNIIFLLAEDYKRLKEFSQNIGVFINGNSFAEMNPTIVKQYFELIESYPDVYLSNTNPPRWEGEHLYAGPETYPYSSKWEFLLKQRQQQYYWRKNYQMISHLQN